MIRAKNTSLIAPCGMNCGICLAYLRDRNRCDGCRSIGGHKANYCNQCIISNCILLAETRVGFCFGCGKYPCRRLRQLDKRYRTRYRMSMIENLEKIASIGLDEFVDLERNRWICQSCGATICVHRDICLECRNPIIR